MSKERNESSYLDFDLKIDKGKGREYPISVINSPAGQARETMQFPFDELALENRLLHLQNALLRSGGKRRRVLLPEEKAVQDFGMDLFKTLFCGEIRSRFDVSQEKAANQGNRLRLKLRIQSPKLAALPWEFLYDGRQGEYLCLERTTPVVRYIELPRSIRPLRVNLPLRILGMIAAPCDLPLLDVEREKQRIEKAVKVLQDKGLLELTWLDGQTWRDLHRAMRSGGPWHMFHFIGHGGFDAEREEGLICLSDENDKKHFMSAAQLGRLLAGHASLRFVLLNACEGARGGNRDIFSSSASTLVRRGIPAVLAMQYEITDQAAFEFSRAFYESLTEGLPVDTSTTEARIAVSLAVNNTLEWGTPVLYMRSTDGKLLTLNREAQMKKKPSKTSPDNQPEMEKSPPTITDETKKETEEMPAEVKHVKKQAEKVYKNKEGFWEAEFAYGIVMVYIPAGEFTMGSNDGSDDEKPEHKIYLDGYWISKFPVTFDQYDIYCEETDDKKPEDRGWGRGKRPVINVSWDKAKAYCEWLNEKTGLGFNIPTEAQWEKAARGMDGRKYPWGNSFLKANCNSVSSNLKHTTPVDHYPKGISPYGLMDTSGNVFEWCLDFFDKDYYKKSTKKNPEGPARGTGNRVVRGGALNQKKEKLRTSSRGYSSQTNQHMYRGFRLTLTSDTNKKIGDKPLIKQFIASNTNIEKGSEITFNYEVENANLPIILKREHDDSATGSHYKLFKLSGIWTDKKVNKNSKYTLEANNINGKSSKIIEIHVEFPIIVYFKPSKTIVFENEHVDISWEVKNAIQPVILMREDDYGMYTYGEYSSFKKTVPWKNPKNTSTFVLKAINEFGLTTTKSILITVKKIPDQVKFIIKQLSRIGMEKFHVPCKGGNYRLQSFNGPVINIPDSKSIFNDLEVLENLGIIKYSKTNNQGENVYNVSNNIHEFYKELPK